MAFNALLFALLTWVLTAVIGLLVAVIIKTISFFVQRGGGKAPPAAARQI